MGDGGNQYWNEGVRHAHDGWWGGPLHLILLVAFLALLIAGGVWLVRRVSRSGFAGAAAGPVAIPTGVVTPDPAVATLRMRYATGDVSREEFQRAIEDLTGVAAAQPSGGSEEDETATTMS